MPFILSLMSNKHLQFLHLLCLFKPLLLYMTRALTVLSAHFIGYLAKRFFSITKLAHFIDNVIITLRIYKKSTFHSIFCFFRITKYIYNYNKNIQFEQTVNLNDKYKTNKNIIKFLFKNIVLAEYFEIFKKMDDVCFNLIEIQRKIRTIKYNLKEMLCNVYELVCVFLRLFMKFHLFSFTIIFKLCTLNANSTIYIMNFILDINFYNLINGFYLNYYSIYGMLKFLRKIDEVYICTIRVRRITRDVNKLLIKMIYGNYRMKRTKVIYNVVFAVLKLLRKVFEGLLFSGKMVRISSEIIRETLERFRRLEKKCNAQIKI